VTFRFRQALALACPGVTFSAGMAVVTADRPVQDVLEAADRAMYSAKHAGRDQVWVAGDDGDYCVVRDAAFTALATPVG
jgi:CRISPR/Cas system-associated protein Cas10 (large subunit of type III CRISPR-Cas system)